MFLSGIGEWFKTILSNDKDKIFFFIILGICVVVAALIALDKYLGIRKRNKFNKDNEE